MCHTFEGIRTLHLTLLKPYLYNNLTFFKEKMGLSVSSISENLSLW